MLAKWLHLVIFFAVGERLYMIGEICCSLKDFNKKPRWCGVSKMSGVETWLVFFGFSVTFARASVTEGHLR